MESGYRRGPKVHFQTRVSERSNTFSERTPSNFYPDRRYKTGGEYKTEVEGGGGPSDRTSDVRNRSYRRIGVESKKEQDPSGRGRGPTPRLRARGGRESRSKGSESDRTPVPYTTNTEVTLTDVLRSSGIFLVPKILFTPSSSRATYTLDETPSVSLKITETEGGVGGQGVVRRRSPLSSERHPTNVLGPNWLVSWCSGTGH